MKSRRYVEPKDVEKVREDVLAHKNQVEMRMNDAKYELEYLERVLSFLEDFERSGKEEMEIPEDVLDSSGFHNPWSWHYI